MDIFIQNSKWLTDAEATSHRIWYCISFNIALCIAIRSLGIARWLHARRKVWSFFVHW